MTLLVISSVGGTVESKICTNCKEIKDISDFYVCGGQLRGDCKECTKKKNLTYQRKHKTWLTRFKDMTERREYMKEYYANNKEKFAEIRRRFKEKHPDYGKEYARERRNKINDAK